MGINFGQKPSVPPFVLMLMEVPLAAEFNLDNFEAEVLGSSVPVLIDFWSDG